MLLSNGLQRYYADRVRDLINWRYSDTYDIIDRLQGFQHPIARVQGVSAMEAMLKELNR